MGGFDFDRQTFARPTEPAPKPKRPSAIPGSLILLVVLAAGGFAAYRYLNINSGPRVPENDAALQQIQKRLDVLEHRMDQMERRRKAFLARPLAPVVEDEPAYTVSPLPVRHSTSMAGSSPLQYSRPAPLVPVASEPVTAGLTKLSPGNSAGNQAASTYPHAAGPRSQQEWEATADRLGDVVGELATQRNELDQTQESLSQLSNRLGHSDTPFTLQKGARPQQVGPIRLRLEGADVKNQRYTMRLFMGDQSIELKNRALHEAIQFYASGSEVPFELVVSQIGRDGVTGRLSLPARTSAQ